MILGNRLLAIKKLRELSYLTPNARVTQDKIVMVTPESISLKDAKEFVEAVIDLGIKEHLAEQERVKPKWVPKAGDKVFHTGFPGKLATVIDPHTAMLDRKPDSDEVFIVFHDTGLLYEALMEFVWRVEG